MPFTVIVDVVPPVATTGRKLEEELIPLLLMEPKVIFKGIRTLLKKKNESR
jgi:hypothetical protein